MRTLSPIEKSAARALRISFNDLEYMSRNCYGDYYRLNDGRVSVDGLFYGYNKRDIYRSLLRKLLNRYGIVYDSTPAYLEHVKKVLCL